MTGKQRAFIDAYLGRANYNATAAAKMVYKANGQHSFEEIGHQNLQKPEIRSAIESYWQASKMSRDEVLAELARLAKSRDHKDQVKALALLSQHFGLLNGGGSTEEIQRQAEQMASERMEEYAREVEKEVDEFNRKAAANNRDKDKQFNRIVKRYQHSPEAVEALQTMFRVMKDQERVEEDPEPTPQPEPEVEIIPPSRRLQAAPVERMLEPITPEIVEPDPEPCGHGYIANDCYICDHLAATQRAWFG